MLKLRPRTRSADRRLPARATALQRLRRVGKLRRASSTQSVRPAPFSRRRLALTLAPIALLIFLVFGIAIGRRYATQKFSVETSIRAQLIPSLEKQLGKKVEVGRIESDYFSRITLHDVVIGRDKNSPLGAWFQAKTVLVNLDVISLALRRDDPLQAISRVQLQSPQLDLRRDAAGHFNFAQLLKNKNSGGAKWRGAIEADDARVFYRDDFLRSTRGKALEVDAREAKIRANFDGKNPVQFRVFSARAIFPREQVSVENARVLGSAASDGAWLSLQVAWPRAPAKTLCEYAFRRGDLVAQSGVVNGKLNIMWERARPAASQFSIGGKLVLDNATGYTPSLKEPGTTHPLLLQNISGALTFSDKAFQSAGLSLVALSTPLRGFGSLTFLPRPIFDLSFASNSFPTTRALELMRRASTTANNNSLRALDSVHLQTGAARGSVRVAGDARDWTASGRLVVPALAVSDAKFGVARAQSLSADFAFKNQNGRFAIKAIYTASDARGASTSWGAWQSSGAATGRVQWTNAQASAPLEVAFSVPSVSGQQTQIGAWRGQNVLALLRTQTGANAPLALQLNVEKLAGRHPRFGTFGARALHANIDARGSDFSAGATAQSALGQSTQFGAFSGNALQIAANGNWKNGFKNGVASLRAQDARAHHAKFGAAQFANLQTHAQVSDGRVLARWNARGAEVQTLQNGAWRAASLIGEAAWKNTGAATPVFVDVEAQRFYGAHARYGFLKGAAIRARASTSDVAHGEWRGVAALGQADFARAHWQELSPELAKQVSDVGALSGKFRFSGLSGKSPIVKGRATLSRVVVAQNHQRFALSNIQTLVAFDRDSARLSNLHARSDYGIVRAEINADLKRGGAAFSILAPDVVLTGAQINEYLKPAGISVSGEPRARLQISAGSGALLQNSGFKNAVFNPNSNKAQAVRARFEIALPQGRVRYASGAAPISIRAQDAKLQGNGTLTFSSAQNWRFAGAMNLLAARAAREDTKTSVQNSPLELRAGALQIAARGVLARTPRGFAPQLAGQLRAADLVFPLSNGRAGAPTTLLPVRDARAEFVADNDSIQVPRFSANAGENARLVGHLNVRRANGLNASTPRFDFSGQTLLEKFDVARAQVLFASLQSDNREDPSLPMINGNLFASADFSGALETNARGNLALSGMKTSVKARLYNGAARWASTPETDDSQVAPETIPLDAARAAFSFQWPLRADQKISLDEFSLWSEGGRLGARGDFINTPQGLVFNLETDLHALRLSRLARLPSLRPALRQVGKDAAIDGLLGGHFQIRGVAAAPTIEGKADLRLAQAFGVSVESATADVRVEPQEIAMQDGAASTPSTLNALKIAVTNLEGKSRGAGFRGDFLADGIANDWHLKFQTDEVPTNRLLLAAGALNDDANQAVTRPLRALPISGALRANVELSGTLRADDGSTLIAPRAGSAQIESGVLRWRGRELGTFSADLQLQNGALQARRFELKHVAQKPAGEKTATDKTTDEKTDAENSGDGLVRLEGTLPVSLDAPALDARLKIQNERLSFAIEVLQEIRESLGQSGQNVDYLDAVLTRIQSLPSSLEGRLDLDAQLDQSWREPVVAVRALSVRDASFRTPSGTLKALPSLQTRFTYDGNDNGAIAIQDAELRLPASTPGAHSATQNGNDGDDHKTDSKGEDSGSESSGGEDLLIRTIKPGRIVPGGEVSLTAEIVNADLEQLAQWLPALRDGGGAPLVKGRLSDFVVQLAGTTAAPQLTGSLNGEDWRYGKYSLDRVRLDRFSIDGGALKVEPGFLTVVKGDFQSSSAWGHIPWSWGDAHAAPGPNYDGPLEIHLPIAQQNFGALAGIFVPSLQNVRADKFDGEVVVKGTLAAPQLAGEGRIENGAFRFRAPLAEFDAGVSHLTGTLKFEDGNRLQIGEEGLSGKLVSFDEIKAPSTDNEESAMRKERDEKKAREKKSSATPHLSGDVLLRGGVSLALDPRTWLNPAHLAENRYDLQLLLNNGEYSTPDVSGAQNISLAAIWKTSDAPNSSGEAQNAQHVRWALCAAGAEAAKTKGGLFSNLSSLSKDKNEKQPAGAQLVSFGAVRLAPDFAQSLDALGKSRAESFSGSEEFRALLLQAGAAQASTPDASRAALLTSLQSADNQDGRFELRDFSFAWKNVARGSLDGTLMIDNLSADLPPIPLPLDEPPRPSIAVQPASGRVGEGARVQFMQSDESDSTGSGEYSDGARAQGGDAAPNASQNNSQANSQSQSLRLVGSVTIQDAELYGAPQSSENSGRDGDNNSGGATDGVLPIPIPDAPRFDIKIRAGRNVQFISSNLRATISGDLEAAGTPRAPVVFGTLYTHGGQITFPNARARLTSGELNIASRRDPISGAMRVRVEIDATAKGRSGRYDITLRLRGPLDTGEESTQDLRVDVSSNPPLSSDEAFAQLLGTTLLNRSASTSTTGQSNDADNKDNAMYARALAGFVSGPLFSGLEHSLENFLGLDTIALDYRVDEPIGIEVGKAVGSRMYISFRRALQTPLGERTPFDLRLEYRIKGDLNLGVETDETGSKKLTVEKRWRF